MAKQTHFQSGKGRHQTTCSALLSKKQMVRVSPKDMGPKIRKKHFLKCAHTSHFY